MKTTTVILIALTIMGCSSVKKTDALGNQEDLEALAPVKGESIENVKWVLSTLGGQDWSATPNSGRTIHFTLDSENQRINGYSGCNSFMGTYTIDAHNRISFSKLASTRMACPDPEINEAEILRFFETADNFTIADGKLSLNKARMAPLAVFSKVEPLAPIVEKYWKLKTLNGKDIVMADHQEREIFITLKAEDNRVTGFAGCNTITGEYSLETGNRIRFSKMATTLRLCPEVAIDESEFLEVFELANNYTINGDQLALNVGRRAPLAVFEAVYFD